MSAPRRWAVTLWPEWASAIAWADKRVENRDWAPTPRDLGPGGWICIHAGSTVGGLGRCPQGRELFEAYLDDRAGALQSVFDQAREAGWTWVHDPTRPVDMAGTLDQIVDLRNPRTGLVVDPRRLVVPVYSAIVAVARVVGVDRDQRTGWDVPGALHWRLEDVRRLPAPVPCSGARRLWPVPDHVAAGVRAQLDAVTRGTR